MVGLQTDFFAYKDCLSNLSDSRIINLFEHVVKDAEYTISITVYKRAAFLKQCLESAIHQDTTIPYEIIVIDDDPTRSNEVEQLMREYSDCSLVSYYKKTENEGLMNNMNRSIINARTDWVIMIHDDDWLCNDYIGKINSYRHKHPSYSIYVPSKHTFYFDRFVNTKSSIREWICKVKGTWRITPLGFIDGTCATPTGTTYNRAKFIKSGGYNPEYGMAADYVFFARYSANERILRINEKLFNYRFAENESLKSETMDNFKVIGHYLSVYLLNRYQWLCKQVKIRYEKTRLWNDFHGDELEMKRLFPCEEIERYSKVPYSPILYKMINLFAKMSVF